MPHTPQHAAIVCTHERRPGTTVCLRCRQAERRVARERLKRLLLRGGALTIVFATIVTAGVFGRTAMRGRASARQTPRPAEAAGVIAATAPDSSVADSTTHTASDTTALGQRAAVAASARPTPSLAPQLPLGETPLPNGVTALRVDSLVTVSFDSPAMRTRLPSKFEQLVRVTLPAIYGPAADSALAKIPEGGFARQGNLITELPSRGVRIPLESPWEIRVFPETRRGQDGLLVFRYRVSIVSTTE